MKPTETTDLDENVARWLDWDKNEATRAELKALVDAGDRPALLRLFGARLAFGTAGIRGRMGPGPGRMNHLVIVQTTQGLVAHLLGEFPRQQDRQRGVVVGYDGRHNSRSSYIKDELPVMLDVTSRDSVKELLISPDAIDIHNFAEITASIILKAGVPVYLFSRLCPTPFVPFAIRQHNLLAGIMITASHNPKEDNGYKVYWQNGAQIIPPHDKGIQGQILGNLEPWPGSWDTSALGASDMLRDPLQAARDQYFRTLGGSVLDARLNSGTSLRFTYTAMHGVGHAYMAEAFRSCCFQPLVTVEEQKDPDPEFPTVKFPNPEEGKSALDLSMRTADASGSTVIIANDPDADRLAVAEKDVQTGAWRVFSGNELGALLGWWSLHCYTRTHPGAPLRDVYMLSSTVSSMILDTMARAEGFNFIETLTGFKWMGNVAADLLAAGKTVLFAFEEAIGFMWGTSVLDKDGISAGVKAAELAAFLDSRGQTLGGKLADIYDTYGHHISLNSYYFCHDQEVIKKLFNRLRNFSGEKDTTRGTVTEPAMVEESRAERVRSQCVLRQYPRHVLGGKHAVTAVRDLTTGHDSSRADGRAVLPVSRSSQMITFSFDNGLVATLRTSGTEPKIKYLTELRAAPGQRNVAELKEVLHTMVAAIVEEFLQPEKNNLIPRAE